jgi:hypothetical protein
MPNETNPPLAVDPDAVLPFAIPFQGFQAIARRNAQIFENTGLVQHAQLAQCARLNVRRQLAASPAGPNKSGLAAGEGSDHDRIIT